MCYLRDFVKFHLLIKILRTNIWHPHTNECSYSFGFPKNKTHVFLVNPRINHPIFLWSNARNEPLFCDLLTMANGVHKLNSSNYLTETTPTTSQPPCREHQNNYNQTILTVTTKDWQVPVIKKSNKKKKKHTQPTDQHYPVIWKLIRIARFW